MNTDINREDTQPSFPSSSDRTDTPALFLSPQEQISAETGSIPQVITDRPVEGRTEPRIHTPERVPPTEETSEGFQVITWWKDALDWEPLPHQAWLVIHGLELKCDNTYRFRELLVEMARQNGKTHFLAHLILYFLVHRPGFLVLATSAVQDIAKESWMIAVDQVLDHPEVFGNKAEGLVIRYANGQEELKLPNGSRYKIAAANRKGGRGLSGVDLVVEDELREHRDWSAHSAAANATTAKSNSQVWMITNAGDDQSVVLNHYRALFKTNEAPTFFYAGWSAPEDCDITDPENWAMANPALGTTISLETMATKLKQPAAVFKTENLCISVASMDEAISEQAWGACHNVGTLENYRRGLVGCLDISPDMAHATIVVAAKMPDGRIRIETAGSWSSTADMRRDLPDLLAKLKLRAFGWFPGGPAAAVSTDLRDVRNSQELPSTASTAACMGIAEAVQAGLVAHSGQELLTAHLLSAAKLQTGDGWRFSRRDGGQCDAAYAAAGAVHLARSMPKPSSFKFITAKAA